MLLTVLSIFAGCTSQANKATSNKSAQNSAVTTSGGSAIKDEQTQKRSARLQLDGGLSLGTIIEKVANTNRTTNQISGPIFAESWDIEYDNVPKCDLSGCKFKALSFGEIVERCLADKATCRSQYPGIKPMNTTDLTEDQLLTHFASVIWYLYAGIGSKSYWYPATLVDAYRTGKDLCERKLGTPWRMIRHSDLAQYSDLDYAAIATALSISKLETIGTRLGLEPVMLDPATSMRTFILEDIGDIDAENIIKAADLSGSASSPDARVLPLSKLDTAYGRGDDDQDDLRRAYPMTLRCTNAPLAQKK